MANILTRPDALALIPPEVANEVIAGTRKQSVAMQLMTRLPNMGTNVREMPVLSALPAADFVNGDLGMKITTNAQWNKLQLTVGEIAAIVPIPEAVLDDSDYDLWAQISPLIVEKIGRVIDRQVFMGGNPKAPSTWVQGIIPTAITKGNNVALGTGVDALEDINQLFTKLETTGYDVSAIAANPVFRTTLRGLRASDGQFIYSTPTMDTPGTIYGIPTSFTAPGTWDAMGALAIAGDWSKAVYAMRQDITVKRFDSGVISNDDGTIAYNLIQQDMIAIRVVMRFAWQIVNPIDIDRQGGTPFPFAVLTPT